MKGSDRILLVDKEYVYPDLDSMEIQNDSLAYKIAEIAREELERINKAKFLNENPEFYSPVNINDVEASSPY